MPTPTSCGFRSVANRLSVSSSHWFAVLVSMNPYQQNVNLANLKDITDWVILN